MKLALSNIAWEENELDDHLALMSRLGCRAMELAPSCVWPEPVHSTSQQRIAFKQQLRSHGIDVIGLHALLFTKPELTLFETSQRRRETGEYLCRLFELCRFRRERFDVRFST